MKIENLFGNQTKLQKELLGSSRAGFTLVELMVVVAIIGILAAIGVPQFQKFQAKARQTEAKTGLAGLYSALKAYQAESTTYTSCLFNAGYAPDTPTRAYSIGFALAGTGANTCGPAGNTSCNLYYTTGNIAGTACTLAGAPAAQTAAHFYPATIRAGTAIVQTVAPGAGSVLSQSTFTAAASGSILTGTADQWTITQDKTLTNSQNGL
jgi:type IV pilus assembly protein PilA